MEGASKGSSEDIYQTLRAEILSLTLKPGQPLGESEVCERFGVSRTPVRSVLQRLQNAGLVQIVPYRGTYVTLLDYADIEQMIYMRVAVESAVVRDFIGLCTPILCEKLRYIIRKQMVLSSQPSCETGQFYELDSQFHEVFYRTARKERLWSLIQRAQISYTRFRMLDITADKQSYGEIVREHEELLDIIRAGRGGDAEELLRRHLYGGINRLGGRIRTEFRDYFQPVQEDDSI